MYAIQEEQNNDGLIIGAMVVLGMLVSLPLPWFTFQAVAPFGKEVIEVSGNAFNGSATLLFSTPLWLLVILAVVGVALSLLNSLKISTLPRLLPVLFLALPAIFMISALFDAFSGELGLQVGYFLFLISLGGSMFHAIQYQYPNM